MSDATALAILTAIGQGMALAGSAWAAFAILRIDPVRAGEVAVARLAAEDEAEDADLPLARELLSQARAAGVGLSWVAVGTAYQIAAAVVPALR